MGNRKPKRQAIKNLRAMSKEPQHKPKISRFAEVVASAKGSVYVIARIRGNNIITLGTGFVTAPYRFITCDHVFNNDRQQHQDGDAYLLIQKDEFANFHRFIITPEKDKSLFCYPKKDVAVLYLPEDFYTSGKKSSDTHLTLSKKIRPLGTGVGVLGYPMARILVTPDGSDIEMGAVALRVDNGALNTGYMGQDGLVINEFTMAFNPGNSGGPIIDLSTGEVIAIVKAYNSMVLKFVREQVPSEQQQAVGETEVASTIRTLYSLGVCSTNLLDVEKAHNLKMK